jgi:ABC-2 type transport system ATP-binding protein
MSADSAAIGDPSGAAVAPGQALVEVEHVSKTFYHGIWPWRRPLPVLLDASLQLRAGETVGLVGGNGSGKTTLMRIIAGTLKPEAGRVTLRTRIGYCPQIPILYDKLTVDETFALFGSAYGLSDDEVRERANAFATRLDFEAHRDRVVEELSGGTREKLNLSLALLHEPRLLLLDEPYAGFDYETYLRFWELSEELRQDGVCTLIISHFVHERSRFDRVLRVQDGVVGDDT